MTYAITSTRTNIRKRGTVSRQLPTFHVEAASNSEARVKALSILGDVNTNISVEIDVQEI